MERTLLEQQLLLRSKYGGVFRALVEKPAPFQLFVFSLPTCSLLTLESHLQELLSVPISTPLAPALNETPEIAGAIRVCAAQLPQSKALATGLIALEQLYKNAKRYKEAEIQFLQACQLLQSHFPRLIELPDCHTELGDVYQLTTQWRQSEVHFLQAILIYSANFPHSWEFACCMRQLGDMYHLNKSEAQYLRAKSIYAHQFPPNCLFAILLASLADLYQEMKRYSESEANYIQAVSTLLTFPETLTLPIVYIALGNS